MSTDLYQPGQQSCIAPVGFQPTSGLGQHYLYHVIDIRLVRQSMHGVAVKSREILIDKSAQRTLISLEYAPGEAAVTADLYRPENA